VEELKKDKKWLSPRKVCFSTPQYRFSVLEPEAAPFAQPEQKETINYVEDDIPADFFDDAQEQAKVVAMSTAQKVTERGDYVSVAEREEEERALRDLVLELDKKNEEEQDSKSEDDEDEVVGVVDLQYEPIYEPLSIVPQTAIREVGKPATSITEATSATLTTSDSAVVSEMALESEFERYQRELEDRAKEKVYVKFFISLSFFRHQVPPFLSLFLPIS
jgi:hypothetical protein